MKDHVHGIMTKESVKLLPGSCREFFAQTFQGKTALDLVTEGAEFEDKATEPLGLPKNIYNSLGEWIFAGPMEEGILALVNWFKDNTTPWLEHYWSQKLGPTGLKNPLMITGLTFRAAPRRAQEYWDDYVVPLWRQGTEAARAEALGFFGRVVHLLQDMGTPAHVNNDCHMALDLLSEITDGWASFADMGLGKLDDDDFEEYVGAEYRKNPQRWTADPAKHLIYYDPGWTLREFNHKLAEIAIQYDSDDVDGTGSGRPYRWDSIFESADPHRDITFDLTDYACNAIAANLIPTSMSFAAGLMLMFMKKVAHAAVPDMYVAEATLKKITVHDDTDPLGSGEIYINAPLFGKRFGRYSMSDGETRTISKDNSISFLLHDGQDLRVHFDAFDDDSWYFQPKEKESLGAVDVVAAPEEWRSWAGTKKKYSIRTSNRRATLGFDIAVSRIQDDSEERRKKQYMPMPDHIGHYPPLEYSSNDPLTKVHHEHCYHLKRILPENLTKLYMFYDEFVEMCEEFKKDPASFGEGEKRAYFERIVDHQPCKTCKGLREWRRR